jgi:hypothetical protein
MSLVETKSDFCQLLESLETKSRLENYNIICLFDVEFPYTKQLFKNYQCMIKNR